MNTQTANTTFDKNQVKEFICRVEDDAAKFIGAEFCAARIIGNISRQRELGDISDEMAAQLLKDAHHLMALAGIGHRYVRMVRTPSAEIRIMVLADEKRCAHDR